MTDKTKQKQRDELVANINTWTKATNYQGIPFRGYEKINAHRKDHKKVITAVLKCLKNKNYNINGKSVIDIGSNIGYFAFTLRNQGAGTVYMVERQGHTQNAMKKIIEIEELKNVKIIGKNIDSLEKAELLPKCDIVIYKSVHHWVKKFSNDEIAERIFKEITKNASLVIYEPGCFGNTSVTREDNELSTRAGFEVTTVISHGFKGRDVQVCLR